MLKAIPLVLFRYPSLAAVGCVFAALAVVASMALGSAQAAPLPNVVYDGAPAAFAAQPEPAAPAAVQPLASRQEPTAQPEPLRQEPTAQPEPLRQELVAVAAPPTAQPVVVVEPTQEPALVVEDAAPAGAGPLAAPAFDPETSSVGVNPATHGQMVVDPAPPAAPKVEPVRSEVKGQSCGINPATHGQMCH